MLGFFFAFLLTGTGCGKHLNVKTLHFCNFAEWEKQHLKTLYYWTKLPAHLPVYALVIEVVDWQLA